MPQSINLIPEQEIQEQTKTKVVKFSTILSILILVIIGGVSAYFFYSTATLRTQISAVDSEIENLRSDITSLSPIEVSARNLSRKYQVLQSIFSGRTNFSLLVEELNARSPETVNITSFSIAKDNQLNISGVADNYISIATFTNNLLSRDFQGGNPMLVDLFTSVVLNSVSLDQGKGTVKFAITLDYNLGSLTK